MPSQTRRSLLGAAAAASLLRAAPGDKPAILGGTPIRSAKFPSWPVFGSGEETGVLDVLKSGLWNRGKHVARFEEAYSKLTGSPHCLAVANGTSALVSSLHAMGIGPGDEVIVPVYTFGATVNAVLLHHALPVFVDTDPETFQIDASKIEARITDRTAAIIPVHLGGASADLDAVLAIGKRRNLPVLEDACQAHLGEWRGRKVGTYGVAGCFSFQASKNLNSGEGGAILSADSDFIERCYAYHNAGRARGTHLTAFSYQVAGNNVRLTEFQAALLVAQMERLEAQSSVREKNAAALTSMLREIPGIHPARMYEGCTRNAYHLYMLRYDSVAFADMPREKFLNAMKAEGIPAYSGYSPLNQEPYLKETLQSRGFQRVYSPERLAAWRRDNQCPANDQLCRDAVWLIQTMLLGTPKDMEDIANAVRRIQKHAPEIAKV
jgi:perosamine synthetase